MKNWFLRQFTDASFQKKAFWLTFSMSGWLKYESEFFMCASLFEKNFVQSSEKVFLFFVFFYAECVFLNTFLAGMNFIRGVAQTKSCLDFSVSLLFAFFPTIRQGRPENEEPGSRRSRAARRKFLFVLLSDYLLTFIDFLSISLTYLLKITIGDVWFLDASSRL